MVFFDFTSFKDRIFSTNFTGPRNTLNFVLFYYINLVSIDVYQIANFPRLYVMVKLLPNESANAYF